MTSERQLDRRAARWLIGAMVVVWLCTITGCGTTHKRVRAALAAVPPTLAPPPEDAVEVRAAADRPAARGADVRGVSLADPPPARRAGPDGWSG